MKKSLLIIALAVSIISCNKEQTTTSNEMKTAYVDTAKLMEEYTEAKDLEAKFKSKSEAEAKKFEVEEANFKAEVANFQKNAQANGQAWAQQKNAELEQKQQRLQYAAQSVGQKLQTESATEMDSLVKGVKSFIKGYGKDKGYDFIYGTGDAATVLYAKDQYDITAEVIKLINEKYAADAKKEPATDAEKEEAKK
ncbi:OmpH family outer membrane protein [Flavobacterium tegetincola]|uniref:OmpH family outer membrane protein n=1 Tax=Flavobacterium tegetincola TaxID=150172 RepID=UPI000407FB5A|nr:OmpH family outer membrane protein [Flavobacterium tegetincola]